MDGHKCIDAMSHVWPFAPLLRPPKTPLSTHRESERPYPPFLAIMEPLVRLTDSLSCLSPYVIHKLLAVADRLRELYLSF